MPALAFLVLIGVLAWLFLRVPARGAALREDEDSDLNLDIADPGGDEAD